MSRGDGYGKTLVVCDVRNRVRRVPGRCGYHHRDNARLHHGRQRIVICGTGH